MCPLHLDLEKSNHASYTYNGVRALWSVMSCWVFQKRKSNKMCPPGASLTAWVIIKKLLLSPVAHLSS